VVQNFKENQTVIVNFYFLGTRIRGYDAVQFRTCGRGANKNHARATKRMCAHGTCGKRGKARIAPKMKDANASRSGAREWTSIFLLFKRVLKPPAATADYTQ
jgi:hypothetical protein